MAEGVVDALEVVDVDKQQGQRAAGADQQFQALEQLVAVGQLGQRVEVGEKTQALLGLLAVTDIAQQHQVVLAGIALEGCHRHFQGDHLAVAQGGEFQVAVGWRLAQAFYRIALQ